jgi:hypothetical protein
MQQEEELPPPLRGRDAGPDERAGLLQRAIGGGPQRDGAAEDRMLDQQKAQAELFKTKLETGARRSSCTATSSRT